MTARYVGRKGRMYRVTLDDRGDVLAVAVRLGDGWSTEWMGGPAPQVRRLREVMAAAVTYTAEDAVCLAYDGGFVIAARELPKGGAWVILGPWGLSSFYGGREAARDRIGDLCRDWGARNR